MLVWVFVLVDYGYLVLWWFSLLVGLVVLLFIDCLLGLVLLVLII